MAMSRNYTCAGKKVDREDMNSDLCPQICVRISIGAQWLELDVFEKVLHVLALPTPL